MNRKDLLLSAGGVLVGTLTARGAALAQTQAYVTSVPNHGKPIRPPKNGLPRVAVMIGPDTVAIDVAGPWEAFVNAMNDAGPLFETYTVAASLQAVSLDGLWVTPHYTFDNVPAPHVVVVPEQRNLPASIDWVKAVSAQTDVIMSVCTGAFLLAKTGLLDGLPATTHHNGYGAFEKRFPTVHLIRGPRYVENSAVSTSGGESSGIDLALRVIERYYGDGVMRHSAYNLEHVRGPRPRSEYDV